MTEPATPSHSIKLGFFDFPPEIRIKIYRHLLCITGHIYLVRGELIRPQVATPHCDRARLKTYLHPAILLTNRMIYSEARHVLYSENIFAFGFASICWATWATADIPFLEGISPDSRRLIRCVSLGIRHEVWEGRDSAETLKNLEAAKEMYSYVKRNLRLEVLRLDGFGIDEIAESLELQKDQSLEDRKATIYRTIWAQQLLPAMRNLKRLVLPRKIGKTLGVCLESMVSDDRTLTSNDLKLEYLSQRAFWTSVNSRG